jgi:hypothetical protein
MASVLKSGPMTGIQQQRGCSWVLHVHMVPMAGRTLVTRWSYLVGYTLEHPIHLALEHLHAA